jgi:hypothetical protein
MKTFEQKLDEQLQEIRRFLIEKNQKYGSSALEPIRIFSKCDKIEAIKVRIDDKLSRIKLGNIEDDANSDSITDMLGYLLILKIAIRESEK